MQAGGGAAGCLRALRPAGRLPLRGDRATHSAALCGGEVEAQGGEIESRSRGAKSLEIPWRYRVEYL